MGIYKSATKVTSNTRTRKKNDLLKKLLSRVTDNCMNTSSCLARKYVGIFSRRHYTDNFRLYCYWYENIQGYFPADITQTFSACILILIASLNCARKSRSSFRMQQRRQINFYNNISEKHSQVFPFHTIFDFCLHQFSNTNLTLACLCYTSDKKKTTFELQILPTVKFSLHIPVSLSSLKNCMGSRDKDY